MDVENLLATITLYALPTLLAITLHEAAHGFVALKFGDRTAWMLGRVTANPLKHIDPIGTVLLPILFLMAPSGVMFGWAKPVPINMSALRHPKRDMLWVAAAGPGANLLMALGWTLVLKLAYMIDGSYYGVPLEKMAKWGIYFNALLAAFNLLPIPPLDGGRILISLLPHPWDARLAKIEPFGFFILIGLLFTPFLGLFISPLVSLIYQLLNTLL